MELLLCQSLKTARGAAFFLSGRWSLYAPENGLCKDHTACRILLHRKTVFAKPIKNPCTGRKRMAVFVSATDGLREDHPAFGGAFATGCGLCEDRKKPM